jgi:ubiquitin carboxyl-terminal hydrolase 48
MSHIEEVFKRSEEFDTCMPVSSKQFISFQYEGMCENFMKCSTCKTTSEKESGFLELLVSLNDDKYDILQNSIMEYIGVELLREDNRYNCSKCNSKQDAECSIVITKLPQILNFQVLRFDYDVKLMKRKKKTTTLYFPVELDMTPYMKGKSKKQLKRRKTLVEEFETAYEDDNEIERTNASEQEDNIYELTSYLIHKGVNAESGHYIAHVKDEKTGDWYLFNDEVVNPLEINSLVYVKNKDELDKEIAQKEKEKTRDRKKKNQKEVIELDMSDDEEELKKPKKKVNEKKLEPLEVTPAGFFKCDSCYFFVLHKKKYEEIRNPYASKSYPRSH